MTRTLGAIAAIATLIVAACGNTQSTDDPTYPRDELLRPSTCKKCHAQHYDEWSGSMHAYASKDPVFRAMNARGQREAQLGDFCVKCHAPMAVLEKKTTDGLNLDSLDGDERYQGITCYFCHDVADVTSTHNNPLVLANDTTMRGGYVDPVKNEAHHSTYSGLHDSNDIQSSKLCGSCHDISVPAHFSGATDDVKLEQTYAEWQSSLFATGKAPLACGQCHFDQIRPVAGTTIADYPGVHSRPVRHGHMFPGVDVALTDFPNKDKQLKAVKDFLTRPLRIQGCVNPAGGAVRVQLENTAAGHNVPSGASQDRRLWAEVHAYDNLPGQPDHETVSRGVVPPGTAVVDLLQTEPDLMLFRQEAFDKDGTPAHMFWQIAELGQQTRFSGTIGVPLTSELTDPRYHKNFELRVTPSAFSPSKGSGPTIHATVTLHMQPIGREVLDDLVSSGDLDASIVDAMPTLDVLPNADSSVTVDWRIDSPNLKPGDEGWPCVETAPSPF